MSNPFIAPETHVQALHYKDSFAHLTEKEKNYAYFLNQASWAGAKMVFHQISYEAPAIFLLIQAYFQNKNFFELEESALK